MTDLQCACTLIVTRHGEADDATSRSNDAGGSLTALGRAQSRSLGGALRERRVAHVYSSPLPHAVRTAEIAAEVLGTGVTTRDGLRELTADEPGAEVLARVRETVETIGDLHRGETVLVVGHGEALRLALPLLTGPPEAGTVGRLGHCGMVEMAVDADGWVCRVWPGEDQAVPLR